METKHKQSRSKALPIVIVLCVTALLIALVGGWVYIEQQKIVQKDRELTQQEELKKYEQEQINKRNEKDNNAKECAAATENNPSGFGGMFACRND